MSNAINNSFFTADNKVKEDELDLTRRAIIVGGIGLLAGGQFGCGATATKPAGNPEIGVDGRNYRISSPTGPAKEIRLEVVPTKVELAPNKIVKAWTYNGKLPGTEIRVKEGERVRITVNNKLPEETTIHWHGQFQSGTNKMDGVPGVTQDAIAMNSEFIYGLRAEPAGSFSFFQYKVMLTVAVLATEFNG